MNEWWSWWNKLKEVHIVLAPVVWRRIMIWINSIMVNIHLCSQWNIVIIIVLEGSLVIDLVLAEVAEVLLLLLKLLWVSVLLDTEDALSGFCCCLAFFLFKLRCLCLRLPPRERLLVDGLGTLLVELEITLVACAEFICYYCCSSKLILKNCFTEILNSVQCTSL